MGSSVSSTGSLTVGPSRLLLLCRGPSPFPHSSPDGDVHPQGKPRVMDPPVATLNILGVTIAVIKGKVVELTPAL